MNGTEFLFSFFGLLLGLAIANIAAGFGEIWRGRQRWRIGLATPLLGLFVMLAVAQQWLAFWNSREILEIRPGLLLASIGVAFPYIFISSAMYPRSDEDQQSLDDYYLSHSRVFMLALLIPSLVNLSVNLAIGGRFLENAELYYVVRLGVPILLMFSRRPVIHYAGLTVLCLTMVARIFVS